MQVVPAERRLAEAGLLHRVEGRARTTRRWQAMMMRVAARLIQADGPSDDPRVAIATAVVETFPEVTDDVATDMVALLLCIEAEEACVALDLVGGSTADAASALRDA